MAAHTDLTLNEILLRLRKLGFRYGTSTFFELMRRPIYKGMIEIAAWRDEPAEIVKGIHDPIISAELWDTVQQIRFEAPSLPRPAKARGGVQAAYPLRGQLACPACSTSDSPSVVTASASRGNGVVYAYYHCHHCGAYRARAADVHDAVEGYLRQIQIHPALAALYREVAVDMSHETLAGREAVKTSAKAEVETAEAKLLRADTMFFDGTLEADSYARLKAKLKDDNGRARQPFELAEAGGGGASVTPDDIRNAADLLESLPLAWSQAMRLGDVEAVHDLIGSVAPGKIAVENGSVLTIGASAKTELLALKTRNADPEEGPASGLVAGARFELTIFGL